MWAKVLTQVVTNLLLSFASYVAKKAKSYFKRKKRIEETQEAAQEIQDAKTQDDVRRSVDNLP